MRFSRKGTNYFRSEGVIRNWDVKGGRREPESRQAYETSISAHISRLAPYVIWT